MSRLFMRLALALSFTHPSFAGDSKTPAVQCPTPHPKYTDILKKLEGMVTSFNEKAECKSIGSDVQELLKIYREGNRTLLGPAKKAITKLEDRTELSVDQMKAVSQYSEDITTSIGSVIQKLQGKPQCLDQKETPVLVTIADIVQETTGIASQYTGPYGIAVGVGGTAIGGILRGISVILERQDDGFDFDEREKRKLFVSSICSYHNVRIELEDIINPEDHISTLQEIKDEMPRKRLLFLNPKADLNGDGKGHYCELCADLDVFYRAQKILEEAFSKELQSLNQIRELIKLDGKEWDTCIKIAELKGDSKATDLGFQNYKSESASSAFKRLQDVLNTLDTIPDFKTCASFREPQEVRKANQRSLALIDYMTSTSHFAFKTAYNEAIKLGKKKYIDELNWSYNPVDYMAHTLMKMDWVDEQLQLMRALSNGGSAQIQREINEMNLFLRDRYFADLAPRFLKWHEDDVTESVDKFKSQAKKVVSELSSRVLDTGSKWIADADELPAMIDSIKQKTQVNHSYVFSLLNQLLFEMNTATKSYQAVQVYCKFFNDSFTMTREIENVCTDEKTKEVEEIVRSQVAVTTSIKNYVDWATTENKIPRQNAKDLLKRVREFRESIKILP